MSVENLDKFWESEGLDSTTLLTGRSGGRNLLTPSAGGISLYGDSLTGGAGGGGLVSTLSARAVTSYAASAAGTQTNGTAPALFSVASAQAAMVPPSAAASVAVTSSGSVSSGVTDGAGSVSDASATGGLSADSYDTDGSNDSRDTATVLTDPAGTLNSLSIHSSTDRDFYKLVLENDATGENFVDIAFAADQGNLDLHLINSSGTVAVKTGTATEDGKRIDLNGLAAGTYYIRVQGVSGSQNTYSLSWDGNNYGLAADACDTAASNDSRSTATVLSDPAGTLNDLTIHSRADRDFYKLVLENDATGKNFVDIAFAVDQGNLDLHLINSSGTAVKTGTATENGKRIDLNGLAAGTYYIRVQGVSGSQNSYSLSWDNTSHTGGGEETAPDLDPTGMNADVYDTDGSNDSRSTATILPEQTGMLSDLTIHSSTDRDFYKLVLENDATGKNFVNIAFAAGQGDLALDMVNSNGSAVVKTGTATDSGKRIDLNGLAAGTYYIRVQSVSGSQNTYSLSWDGTNYGLALDAYDADTPNDSRDTATVLPDPAGTLNSLSIHNSADRDFYKLVLENDATGKNFVDIAFAAGQGDLALHLINSSGSTVVKTGTATDGGKRIDLSGLAAGTYYIRVQSVSGSQNTYSLSWGSNNYGLAADAYDSDGSNDSRATATVLPDLTGTLNSLTIHNSADRDFYKLVLENDATGENFVNIAFAADLGDLDLHLVNSSGSAVVKTGTATDGGKSIDLKAWLLGRIISGCKASPVRRTPIP